MGPQGCFWEFSHRHMHYARVYVLIDDKTQKIVAQTFDTSPEYPSKLRLRNYGKIKEDLFDPQKNNFRLKSVNYGWDFNNIFEKISQPGKYFSLSIVKRTLDCKNISGKGKYESYLTFIDDNTGEIVLNSADYEKSYLGEEDFKKDVNKLLLKYSSQ